MQNILDDDIQMQKHVGVLVAYLLTPWSIVLLEKLTGFVTNQEIPGISWNPKVHYRTHKLPPPVPYWCMTPPLETFPPPGDPSGGVFYLRIVLSPEEASRL